jgi:hypothetical protein
LIVALAGCVHHHLPWNAPGIIDVRTPPQPFRTGDLERPKDPGERMVAFTYGGFSGGGIRWDHGSHGGGASGIEVSLHQGESSFSHYDDDFWIYPQETIGVNLGATLEYGDGPTHLGAIYVEAQRMKNFLGAAAGWAYEPTSGRTGPQATVFFSDFYVRGDWLFGAYGGGEIMLGLIVKLPVVWVWSR